MSFQNNIPNSNTLNSIDTSKSCQKTSTSEQLNSTAKVFCEAVNQIVKAYLVNSNETNMFQSISFSFAQKVIKKTKISFSQLVVSLVYLNRYYNSIITGKKHIPGHEESVIPSLSHVVLLCIIQAERYVTDIPHKLSWWANICAGQTKSIDINKWQRDFFETIDYKLYVHPEKDYNTFKFQVKRLAARLFNNSVNMPKQFRRSINLGSQPTPTSSSSTHSNKIPSQPNITSTTVSSSNIQPRILLSPLYSGHSNINTSAILSNQTSMISSPLASVHSDNSVISNITYQPTGLNVPVLNITNTNLTTSPVELGIEGTMINQTRSPNSIYTNSQHSYHLDTHNQLAVTSPLPPSQNPNNLMVLSNLTRSPNKKTVSSSISTNSLLTLSNNEGSTITNKSLTQSPSQYGLTVTSSPAQTTTLVSSPIDLTKIEDNASEKPPVPRIAKRKRSVYDPLQISSVAAHFLKAAQGVKRSKISVTISPEEIDYQPNTPSSRPIEENNTKENDRNLIYKNQNISLNDCRGCSGAGKSFQSIDKGKNEDTLYSTESSNHPFHLSEESMSSNVVKNSFLNSLETIPDSTTQNVLSSLVSNNDLANNEEIIVSSLLLASSNSTSLTLIPVSPPLTPK